MKLSKALIIALLTVKQFLVSSFYMILIPVTGAYAIYLIRKGQGYESLQRIAGDG